MVRRFAFALIGLLVSGLAPHFAAAQGSAFGFEYRPVAKIVQGTDTLALPWAGGLNAAQFSNIDLNADGRPDLFCFERPTGRVLTFLDAPAPGGGRRWAYAPDYETCFPDTLRQWALLRDYDCDGRPDLFTRTEQGGSIGLLRNVAGPDGRPRFVWVATELKERYFRDSVTSAPGVLPITRVRVPAYDHILTGTANVPALADVNGDGKLDIVTWDAGGSRTMQLFLSAGPCGATRTFERAGFGPWGGIGACGDCAGFANGRGRCQDARRGLHTGGHALALVDLDGDGDLDALDGRDNCAPLVRLTNLGDAATARFDTAAMSASWPLRAAPARAEVFACASPIDANFDGLPDVAVAPVAPDNLMDKVSMHGTVRLVPNVGTAAAPRYGPAAPFLQSQMLDVSEAAAPTFGDLDGDGLLDMLVGNYADNVNGRYRANLSHYRNVGTRTRPVFRLVTDDYLGLASFRPTGTFVGLKPQLVDLNRDGALDLAFAAKDQANNRIFFILNTAGAGRPVALDPARATYLKGRGPVRSGIIPYYLNDAPHFTDVDGDGLVDLLVGTDEAREPGGVLRYFRNLGLARLDTSFALVEANFGRFGAARGPAGPRLLAPVVADFDGDGLPDLLTAEAAGTLQFVSNYRAQSALFSVLTQAIFNPTTGQAEGLHLGSQPGGSLRFAPAAADLDGDGAPELYLGTEGGGVVAYGTRNRLPLATARAAAALGLGLNVFPNPAQAAVSVESAAPVRLTLFDLSGRVLRPATAPATRHALDVRGLAPGLYLLRATAADGRSAVQRLEVGR